MQSNLGFRGFHLWSQQTFLAQIGEAHGLRIRWCQGQPMSTRPTPRRWRKAWKQFHVVGSMSQFVSSFLTWPEWIPQWICLARIHTSFGRNGMMVSDECRPSSYYRFCPPHDHPTNATASWILADCASFSNPLGICYLVLFLLEHWVAIRSEVFLSGTSQTVLQPKTPGTDIHTRWFGLKNLEWWVRGCPWRLWHKSSWAAATCTVPSGQPTWTCSTRWVTPMSSWLSKSTAAMQRQLVASWELTFSPWTRSRHLHSQPVWPFFAWCCTLSSRLRQNAVAARGSTGSAAGCPMQETEKVKRGNLKLRGNLWQPGNLRQNEATAWLRVQISPI